MAAITQQTCPHTQKHKLNINTCIMLLVGLYLLTAPGYNHAEISIVVSNSNNNELNSTLIRKLFLGKRSTFTDGSPATPIIHNEDAEIAQHFNLMLLNRSPQQIKAYWARMIFTGQSYPPEQVYSDAEVIELIKNDPSTISYIYTSSLTGDIKEVLRITKAPNGNKLYF